MEKHEIRALPTFLLLNRNGDVIKKLEGANEDLLKNLFEESIIITTNNNQKL